MNRQEKTLVIESLKNGFVESKASFIVEYQGLTVKQMQTLRGQLRKNGGKLYIAKARLAKIAAQGVPEAQGLIPYCKNQIGFVFASEEPPVIAKVLHEFTKKNEALSLIVACLDEQLLDSELIGRIANLPSRAVLLAQVCGTIKAPISGLVSIFNQMPARLVWALKQVAAKK
ncbi:50S ribosomal protein L10 [Candidatus Dependentiae bacterium]|nr:50S ribosomal protein L10 [Candidatus Dependentiae bacterium]